MMGGNGQDKKGVPRPRTGVRGLDCLLASIWRRLPRRQEGLQAALSSLPQHCFYIEESFETLVFGHAPAITGYNYDRC